MLRALEPSLSRKVFGRRQTAAPFHVLDMCNSTAWCITTYIGYLIFRLLLLLLCLSLFLRLDLVDVLGDLFNRQLGNFVVRFQHRNLDVLSACLDHLQQRFDCQLDRLFVGQVFFVILFQEFFHGFCRAANGMRLPCTVNSTGFGLVQTWSGIVGVKSSNHGGNTERSDTTGLGVLLLHPRNIFGQVFDGNGIFQV